MRRIILNFHGLGEPHDTVPPDEVPYWLSADKFSWIIERVATHRTEGRDIEITFDDGNLSDMKIADPILTRLGIRASYFVLTGRLGQNEYLDADDVRALAATGAEIGLHGQDHVDWRHIPSRQLETETVDARSRLADVLGAPVQTVSIPFGAYNRRVLTHLIAQGFTAIYTSDRGPAEPHKRIQSRNTIRSDMTEAEVDDIMVGHEPLRARLRRVGSTFARRRLF